MKNIAKLALAGAMVAEASASQSAAELVAEAMSKVQVGSAVHEHLSNAAAALSQNDAATLESHSQLVSVPIDEKRALTLKVSQPTPSISLTALLLRLSERSLVTTPSSPLERRIETKSRTHLITTTLPSP